jgi:hypothetical protein
MAGLKKDFQPLTIISSQEINNNFTVLDTREVIGEDLTAQINGVATVFQTTNEYVAGTLKVYVDGLRYRPTTDYTESGVDTFTIVGDIITVGSDMIVDYRNAEI